VKKDQLMQILKISSIVGAVHFGLFVILAQPGCQSIDRAWEEHRAERGTVLAREPEAWEIMVHPA